MTRHARNCTAGAVYTYHERQKDAGQSGYGSKNVRVGKDSQREFDCCCLTLQPCKNPVVTPDGYLYDKEAILEYILHQKREIARKMKEFEKQKQKLQNEDTLKILSEKESARQKFMQKESDIVTRPVAGSSKADSSTVTPGVSNMTEGKAKTLPSFWVPSLTPKAPKALVKKPDEKVRCPMSGGVLKLKNLTDVHWTHIKDGDKKKSLIVKDARYVCAVTNDVLGNSVPCTVLKTSGNVVTQECIDKIIKKDMIDPTCGKKLTEKDFIPLQRGATGYSLEGIKLEAKKAGPVMMA